MGGARGGWDRSEQGVDRSVTRGQGVAGKGRKKVCRQESEQLNEAAVLSITAKKEGRRRTEATYLLGRPLICPAGRKMVQPVWHSREKHLRHRSTTGLFPPSATPLELQRLAFFRQLERDELRGCVCLWWLCSALGLRFFCHTQPPLTAGIVRAGKL